MFDPGRKRTLFFFGLAALVVLAAGVVYLAVSGPDLVPQRGVFDITLEGREDFFKSFWNRPVPLQGAPPVTYSELEASLRPEACGSCHPQQYADWKESLHSQAMGPGPWGQIVDLQRNNPEEALQCLTCHAPLAEQSPGIIAYAAGGEARYEKNARFDAELQSRGIVCAACHVRQHRRFGPTRADKERTTLYPPGMPNHGGAQRTPHFESAEFCRDCHQFNPENSLLVNGKPLQDTYREWKSSVWARRGTTCQNCHMSDRRHHWKGIHDPAWVKSGVRVEVQLRQPTPLSRSSSVEVSIVVVNSAVGHRFPTYITPKVFVRAALLDSSEKPLPDTQQEKVIGWDARFESGEWKEYFDTRLSPGEKFNALFHWSRTEHARAVRAWVEVHPDHFYHVYFYPRYLESSNLSPMGRQLIEKALRESSRTFVLYEEKLALQ